MFAVLFLGSTIGLSGCGQEPTPEDPRTAEGLTTAEINESPPVNVVLISIDTLRADHLHSYGYGRETSPNIDRLAAEGVLFESAVAESSWTLPSHASMLTGLPSLVHQVVFDGKRLADGHTTVAEVFKTGGYRTHAYVSAPYLHPIFGFEQGFQKYEVFGDTIYDQPDFSFDRMETDPDLQRRFEEMDFESHRTQTSRQVADAVLSDIEAAAGAPFFFFVHFFDVHYDYIPPEPYWRVFNPHYTGDLDARNFATNPDIHARMGPDDLEYVKSLYDGEILWTDEHVGMIIDAIEERGLTDDTLVVITSDHGEEFFEHGEKGHRYTLFDEQLIVPLILRLPGRLPRGLRIPNQVQTIDIMPTILDIVGLSSSGEMLGRSLLSLIDGGGVDADRSALSFLVWPGSYELTSLRRSDRKIISLVTPGEIRPQVFYTDLAENPKEIPRDNPSHDPREIEEMVRTLHELQREYRVFGERLSFSRADDIELDETMRRNLEKLGYIEGSQ